MLWDWGCLTRNKQDKKQHNFVRCKRCSFITIAGEHGASIPAVASFNNCFFIVYWVNRSVIGYGIRKSRKKSSICFSSIIKPSLFIDIRRIQFCASLEVSINIRIHLNSKLEVLTMFLRCLWQEYCRVLSSKLIRKSHLTSCLFVTVEKKETTTKRKEINVQFSRLVVFNFYFLVRWNWLQNK